LNFLESNSKLERDFKNLNQAVEQRAQKEIEIIRSEIRALKEQAQKTGEALMSADSSSEKHS
jgi:hypothetical protein